MGLRERITALELWRASLERCACLPGPGTGYLFVDRTADDAPAPGPDTPLPACARCGGQRMMIVVRCDAGRADDPPRAMFPNEFPDSPAPVLPALPAEEPAAVAAPAAPAPTHGYTPSVSLALDPEAPVDPDSPPRRRGLFHQW